MENKKKKEIEKTNGNGNHNGREKIREYYDILNDKELKKLLNTHEGVVYARMGGHPLWPARICELDEWMSMQKYYKKDHVCVYFFGSNNFGWVKPKSLQNFKRKSSADIPKQCKAKNNTRIFLAGLDEAEEYYVARQNENKGNSSLGYWDRLMNDKENTLKIACQICNKVEPQDNKVICQDCDDHYHISCLPKSKREIPQLEGWKCYSCTQPHIKTSTPASKKGQLSRVADLHHAQSHVSAAHPISSPSSATSDFSSFHKSSRATRTAYVQAQEFHGDERCFICGYGGKVVICDYPFCSNVYHEMCLGEFPLSKNPDSIWFCPRHRCVITGSLEYNLKPKDIKRCLEREKNDKLANIPRLFAQKKKSCSGLWKCQTCPLSICQVEMMKIHEHIRDKTFKTTRREKSFSCPNCSFPSSRVRLAKKLERIWSRMATNRQGYPFLGPLLHGAYDPAALPETKEYLDFRTILSRIRSLRYSSANEMVNDVQKLLQNARVIIADMTQYIHLKEAVDTLELILKEQISEFKGDLNEKADELTERSQTSDIPEWNVAWRSECMPFDAKDNAFSTINTVEPRSMDEWNKYVSILPVDGLDEDMDGESYRTPKKTGRSRNSSNMDADVNASSFKRKRMNSYAGHEIEGLFSERHRDVDSVGDLVDDDEVHEDIARILVRIKEHEKLYKDDHAQPFYFLGKESICSPDTIELEQMFHQQHAYLRRTFDSFNVLRKAWLLSQQEIRKQQNDQKRIKLGEESVIHELRMSNKNLQTRLQYKDHLLDELLGEQQNTLAELKHLKLELENHKEIIQQYKDKESENTKSGEKANHEIDNANNAAVKDKRMEILTIPLDAIKEDESIDERPIQEVKLTVKEKKNSKKQKKKKPSKNKSKNNKTRTTPKSSEQKTSRKSPEKNSKRTREDTELLSPTLTKRVRLMDQNKTKTTPKAKKVKEGIIKEENVNTDDSISKTLIIDTIEKIVPTSSSPNRGLRRTPRLNKILAADSEILV